MVGQTVSHYRVLEKLGEGGMGVVYKAEDLKLGRAVALKFLPSHLLESAEHRARFLHEAKAEALLDHPNICTVYEIDEADGQAFLAMACLAGETLKQKIAQRPLPLQEALDIAIQIGQGLQAAHERGVVHRDIKPANIMITSQGQAKIMDFGLAQLSGRTKLTASGMKLGTPAYMSPEQTEGKATDRRSDIWSLGATLYEMVSGRVPFAGEAEAAVAYGIVHTDPEPLSALRTGVPLELDRIAAKCLTKNPAERYQHAEDLLVDLTALRSQFQGGKLAHVRPAASPRPSPWILATASCVVVAALGFWILRPGASDASRPPQYGLTQITRDTGYTGEPALSPDGRLIAYASDRSGEGNLDIWVQQLGGGDPLRLTSDLADDRSPSFSPDGNRIVFSSTRNGSGLYVVPALGGSERLLVGAGSLPRFSPDGNWISFYRLELNDINQLIYRTYVMAATGGPSRRVETNFSVFAATVWSPDSKFLLGWGSAAPGDMVRSNEDVSWSLVPVQGGDAVRLNIPVDLIWMPSWRNGMDSFAASKTRVPRAWLADGDWVVFDDDVVDARNLWRAKISVSEGRIVGEPQRLTAGTGEETPSASLDGKIVFASASSDMHIWGLPMDLNRAQVTAAPRKITSGLSNDSYPSLSADGRSLVYTSDRAGNLDVWLRDLQTGEDRPLTVTPTRELRGIISPDGSRVAYVRGERDQLKVFLLEIGLGVERFLVAGTSMSWTSDGKSILYYTSSPIRWKTIDVETGQDHDLGLQHSQFPVHSVQLSPDQKWVSFKLQGSPGNRLFVSPLVDGQAADESRWIPIGVGGGLGISWWSPDSNTVYYLSNRDGFSCILAQTLSPETRAPQGPPLEVQHFHDRLRLPGFIPLGPGVTADALYVPLGETKANVWLAEPRKTE